MLSDVAVGVVPAVSQKCYNVTDVQIKCPYDCERTIFAFVNLHEICFLNGPAPSRNV